LNGLLHNVPALGRRSSFTLLFLFSAITHVRRVTVSYFNVCVSTQYDSVNIARIKNHLLWEIAFCNRKSDAGYRI